MPFQVLWAARRLLLLLGTHRSPPRFLPNTENCLSVRKPPFALQARPELFDRLPLVFRPLRRSGQRPRKADLGRRFFAYVHCQRQTSFQYFAIESSPLRLQILNFLFLVSPRVAYNFSELIEFHAGRRDQLNPPLCSLAGTRTLVNPHLPPV